MFRPSLAAQLALAVVVALLAPLAWSKEQDDVRMTPDVVYGHKDGLALTMDVFQPQKEPKRAAVLFMVSGGWYSRWSPPEQLRDWLRPYLDQGYTLITVRHGSSPRYSIPEAVSDVRRAVRFVRKNAERFQIDADRLGVLGIDAGGHLALTLGATGDEGVADSDDPIEQTSSRVAAVVALVPPTDLRVMVWDAPDSLPVYRNFPALDLPLEKATEQSPLVHVTEDDAPCLVIMGADDQLVPPRHGEWIAEQLEKHGVAHQLIVMPDAGHNLGGEANRDAVFQKSIDWFDQHLGGEK